MGDSGGFGDDGGGGVDDERKDAGVSSGVVALGAATGGGAKPGAFIMAISSLDGRSIEFSRLRKSAFSS